MKTIGITMLLGLLCWTSPAGAEEKLSKASDDLIYRSIAVRVRLPPSVCEKPMTQMSKSSAVRVQKDLKREGAPSFKELIAAVPAKERELPKVKAALAKGQAFLSCLEHIESQVQQLEVSVKQYGAFLKATATADRTMESLYEFVAHMDTPMWAQQAKVVTKWRADLEMVHKLCTGEFKGVRDTSGMRSNPSQDPETRCKTAAIRGQIMQRVAQNYLDKQVSMILDRFKKARKNFAATDGHLRFTSAAPLKALYEPEAFKMKIDEGAKAIFDAAGVKMTDGWREFDTEHAALWAKIRETGPSWEHPKQEGKERQAVKAAKLRFKEHKVMRAHTTRASWTLHRNSRGAVTHRTKIGYILYKVKSDKKLAGALCRAQSFTYEEAAHGRKFKKSTEIGELSYVRFESCK